MVGDEIREGPWMGPCRIPAKHKGRSRKTTQEIILIETRDRVAQVRGGDKTFWLYTFWER